MIGIILYTVASLLAGAVIGVMAVVALGIRREERDSTLTGGTTDRLSLGTRQLTGASVRLPNSPRDDDDPAALDSRQA